MNNKEAYTKPQKQIAALLGKYSANDRQRAYDQILGYVSCKVNETKIRTAAVAGANHAPQHQPD